jgi:hypothetical protein
MTILFLMDFTAGFLGAPFAIVTALVCGRVSLIRYDDKREQLEIVEYCPWLPGRYRKAIPRENLQYIACAISYSDEQELHEITLANTANEFICVREYTPADEDLLFRLSTLLNLNVVRQKA